MTKRKAKIDVWPPELRVLRGWREIRDACGMKCSTQTMRRCAKRYYIPIFYLDNRPSIHKFMLEMWWKKFTVKIFELEDKEKEGKEKSDTR